MSKKKSHAEILIMLWVSIAIALSLIAVWVGFWDDKVVALFCTVMIMLASTPALEHFVEELKGGKD